MKLLKSNSIWNEYVSIEDDKLIDLVNKIEDSLSQAINIKIRFNFQKSLNPVHNDIVNLIKALDDIGIRSTNMSQEYTWGIYFKNQDSLSSDQEKRRESMSEIINSIERLKELKLGE